MRKYIAILLSAFLFISSFSAYAQNEFFLKAFNMPITDVSSIAIQYVAYGIPEQKVCVLDDAALINTLLLQLQDFVITHNNADPYAGMPPQDILKTSRGGYEISFNISDEIRSFWILNDGQIAEYSQILSRLPQFNYYFPDTEKISNWLDKTLNISRIWQSQKQNILLLRDEDIKVYLQIDDIKMRLFFDSQPKIVNGRTMLPVRNVAEALGISVHWNEEKQEVSLNGNFSIILRVGETTPAWYPYGDIRLDVAPFIENGRTYVPLRFISEEFNRNVSYDAATNSVYLSSLIQDGWCVDYKGNYKIKVFQNYNFEGRSHRDYIGTLFTIPFEDLESLSKPVKSIIGAGRINMTLDNVVNLTREKYSYREKFKVESVSENEFFISSEYNESESNNGLSSAQRYALIYLKQDGDTVLTADIDCYPDYFLAYKDDIINNLKSITNIN